ncbi:hypothetical protein [Roseicella sp. DB1501]|uniref:hypothetical protein n=1 Tax=Roseicella sp. DB1501 TaxID=2730925 RepID=UPI0014922C74|nr:hypothetical protein [Roseicella sp. DB1501]NOG73750.1 hypothetical protein [Roseicella sp. DB1501]
MTIDVLASTLNAATAIFGSLSAIAWVRSARFQVPAPPNVGLGGVLGGDVYDEDASGRRFDVLETLKGQSRWNSYAAWLAAGAAACQVAVAVRGFIDS